jgi:hypothetical protein
VSAAVLQDRDAVLLRSLQALTPASPDGVTAELLSRHVRQYGVDAADPRYFTQAVGQALGRLERAGHGVERVRGDGGSWRWRASEVRS